MKSTRDAFYKERVLMPGLSDIMCLAEAVVGKNLSRGSITRSLSELVDKNDYESRDKSKIITNLVALSKRA